MDLHGELIHVIGRVAEQVRVPLLGVFGEQAPLIALLVLFIMLIIPDGGEFFLGTVGHLVNGRLDRPLLCLVFVEALFYLALHFVVSVSQI